MAKTKIENFRLVFQQIDDLSKNFTWLHCIRDQGWARSRARGRIIVSVILSVV